MSIGDSSNNNGKNNGIYEPTYYSRLKFRNDNQAMNITFRSGLLIIEIGENSTSEGYKFVPAETIHLSPIKSLMLVEQIKAFINYRDNEKKIDPLKAFGVNAGMNTKVSYIGFSTNDNKDNIVNIGKFDENGVIVESSSYTFSKDYNYALDWKDIKSNDLSKVYMNSVELDMFINLLSDFGRSMNGAIGYAVADTARYDNGRSNKRIDLILDKLGIERPSYNRAPKENNYLNNASSRSASLEEFEDLMS